jgi:hypothetical protein
MLVYTSPLDVYVQRHARWGRVEPRLTALLALVSGLARFASLASGAILGGVASFSKQNLRSSPDIARHKLVSRLQAAVTQNVYNRSDSLKR